MQSTHTRFSLLSLTLVALLVAPTAQAATIDWQTEQGIAATGDTVVSTAGVLHEAINFGEADDQEVNGVNFVGTPAIPTGWGASVAFEEARYKGGGIGTEFTSLMQSFVQGNSATETITLTGLTNGTEYLIQLFHSDDRTAGTMAATIAHAGTGNSGGITNAPSYALTGLFTADAGTQVVSFTGSGGPIQLMGYQVRAIPTPAALPVGLAMLGLVIVRRRHRR